MTNKDEVLMQTAELWACESKAQRAKVGCVIARDERIISIGYNGTLPGGSNLCEDEDNNTLDEVLHAEQNALMFATKNGISTNGASMYATLSPCVPCSKLIVMAGIKKVYYRNLYRDTRSLEFLLKNGVEVKWVSK